MLWKEATLWVCLHQFCKQPECSARVGTIALTSLRPCIPIYSTSVKSQFNLPFTEACCCLLSAAPHSLGWGSLLQRQHHDSPAAHPSLSWTLLPPELCDSASYPATRTQATVGWGSAVKELSENQYLLQRMGGGGVCAQAESRSAAASLDQLRLFWNLSLVWNGWRTWLQGISACSGMDAGGVVHSNVWHPST